MAIGFKEAYRRCVGGLDKDWDNSPLIKQISNIKLDELSSAELHDLETVCSAFMTAIRSERYEKAGLVHDEPSPESPIRDTDNAHTLRDKMTGRKLHRAEWGALNEGTIADLHSIATSGWRIWISPSEAITLAGHHFAVGLALKKELGKDEYPKIDFPYE
jgi:hypothetical protein